MHWDCSAHARNFKPPCASLCTVSANVLIPAAIGSRDRTDACKSDRLGLQLIANSFV